MKRVDAALEFVVGDASCCAVRDELDIAPYQVAVTVCPSCKAGTQDGGGITVPMSPAAVERALCDGELIGDVRADQPTRAKQAIPRSVRRQVLHRDHFRCCVPGCRSRTNLDIHHIIARADGGTNDLWNLCCLCEGHHLALHAGTLVITGRAPELSFTRRPDNPFSRAVEMVRAKPHGDYPRGLPAGRSWAKPGCPYTIHG